MFPAFTMNDFRNGACGDTKSLCQLAVTIFSIYAKLSNFTHAVLREFAVMKFLMLEISYNLEIGRIIIQIVFIDVMNVFRGFKRTTEHSLGNETVFVNSATTRNVNTSAMIGNTSLGFGV